MIAYHDDDEYANNESKARFSYYPDVDGLPDDLVIDGEYLGRVGYDAVREAFDERKKEPPELAITHATQYSTATGIGSTTISVENISSSAIDGTCLIAICQTDSAEHWGGSQGEDTLFAIFWDMLPDDDGTPISLNPDETADIPQSFTINEEWQREDCYLSVFVQKDNREIVQALEIPLVDATDCKPFVQKSSEPFTFTLSNTQKLLMLKINHPGSIIEIRNSAGRIVKKQIADKQQVAIPLHTCSAGIYFCIVKSQNMILKKKFVMF